MSPYGLFTLSDDQLTCSTGCSWSPSRGSCYHRISGVSIRVSLQFPCGFCAHLSTGYEDVCFHNDAQRLSCRFKERREHRERCVFDPGGETTVPRPASWGFLGRRYTAHSKWQRRKSHSIVCHFEPLAGVPVLSLPKGETPETTQFIVRDSKEGDSQRFPRLSPHDHYHRDSSVAVARLARNDIK